jgi:predicted nucleic acid-binding protein
MNWTRRWWSEFGARFTLVSSSAVIAELRRGTDQTTGRRIALLKNVELLEVTMQVEDVAQVYVDRLVTVNDPGGDALHLALAVVHRVDVLLTWNCRHLANPSKTEHVRLVNYEMGLPVPLLATPLNYLSGVKILPGYSTSTKTPSPDGSVR